MARSSAISSVSPANLRSGALGAVFGVRVGGRGGRVARGAVAVHLECALRGGGIRRERTPPVRGRYGFVAVPCRRVPRTGPRAPPARSSTNSSRTYSTSAQDQPPPWFPIEFRAVRRSRRARAQAYREPSAPNQRSRQMDPRTPRARRDTPPRNPVLVATTDTYSPPLSAGEGNDTTSKSSRDVGRPAATRRLYSAFSQPPPKS